MWGSGYGKCWRPMVASTYHTHCPGERRRREQSMLGTMYKLYKETKRDDHHKDGENDQCRGKRGPAGLIEFGRLWLIGDRLNLFKVAQAVIEIAYRFVA